MLTENTKIWSIGRNRGAQSVLSTLYMSEFGSFSSYNASIALVREGKSPTEDMMKSNKVNQQQ